MTGGSDFDRTLDICLDRLRAGDALEACLASYPSYADRLAPLLRVAAGVPLVYAERFSPWLYVFTTLLALFLALGKRRQEIVLLRSQAKNARAILDHYSLPFLDEMMAVVTAGTVMTYALYTFSAPNLPQNHTMMLTIPFVIYGIFRYLYVIHIQGNGGAPDEVLLTDRPLQVAVGLFGLAVVAILYTS